MWVSVASKLFPPWQKFERLHWASVLGTLPTESRTYQIDYTKYEAYIQPTVLMNVFCAGEY